MRTSVRASAETLRLINRWSRAWWVEGILGNVTVLFENRDGNTKGSCSFNSDTVRQ